MSTWRFPTADRGKIRGQSFGDMEIFRKTPYALFGREIIQNAIDVIQDENKPVKLVFKEFEIETQEVPGLEEYRKQVIRCKKFYEQNEDNKKFCDSILQVLGKKKIKVLRISDFNTSGLIGIDREDINDNNFLAITKGTGVSVKKGVSAGSKGVGKNASINLSQLKMAFYSSVTIDGKRGSLGVCELIAGYMTDEDAERNVQRNYIQGSGYYEDSINTNGVINKLISLDNSYERKNDLIGTDIYIIGFESEEGWETKVLNSALESYLGAFISNKLEIVINGLEVSKENLYEIITSDKIFEKNKASIISQYLILSKTIGVRVYEKIIEYGKYKFYLLPFEDKDKKYATHNCTVIRYPLMKIRDFPLGANIQASAVCIIENDKLGKLLRNIENPQHNDWEVKRITDVSVRRDIVRVINEMKDFFNECVQDCYKLDKDSTIDPYGAGEFLPEFDENNGKVELRKDKNDIGEAIIGKPKRNKPKSKPGIAESDNKDDEGLQPDIGGIIEDEEGNVTYPEGHNSGDGGDLRSGSGEGAKKEGDSPILKKTSLKIFKYYVVCKNRNEGIFDIKFMALESKSECYFNIYLLDDTNGKNDLPIIYAKYKGSELSYADKQGYGPFSVEANENVVLEIKTYSKKQFGSGVNILC